MFKFVMTKNSIELFHRAILSNDLQRTKLILEEAMKDPRFNIDEINDEGLTALQFSCFAGHLEIVQVLVSYKADTRKRDRDGNTLLHAAALAGKPEVVKYLLRCGLKPTVRNDDNQMPVDLTEKVAVIVILLRSMLDQGYLQEMQDYMLDHPKLKRNIFKELERVKCRENEKNQILKELPYSSHTSPRRHSNKNVRIPSDDIKGRSISTFSKLSDSMQNLNELCPQRIKNDKNNNSSYDNAPTLKRHNSTSSSSSHGSRSSRGSGGGILRHDIGDYDARHRQTQKYLENRFPQKSVSFELDNPVNSRYSDGYISDTYDDKIPTNDRSLSRSSSISSYSSNHTAVFSDTCSNFDFPPQTPKCLPSYHNQDENIYQNVQSLNLRASSSLPTINEGENLYENLPLRNSSPKPNVPPPIPPRIPAVNHHPQRQHQVNYYGYDESYSTTSERQMGSETDSGIDINETTAGRMFALSLDDHNNSTQCNTTSQNLEQKTYSKPIGIYYSEQLNQSRYNTSDNAPVFLRPSGGAHLNPKYRSWNGRTLLETQKHANDNEAIDNGMPYMSRRKHSRDDYDAYRTRNDDYYHRPQLSYQQNNGGRNFNFDHQPEIML